MRYSSIVDQTWTWNFTVPTVINELVLSNKTAGNIQSNPLYEFYAGIDDVNAYV
jgi:hypothetical protein